MIENHLQTNFTTWHLTQAYTAMFYLNQFSEIIVIQKYFPSSLELSKLFVSLKFDRYLG